MGSIKEKLAVYVVDPYHEAAIAALKSNKSFELTLPSDTDRSQWPEHATAVLVRSETQITAADLERASSRLKYIVKQGVGVDNIDLKAAAKRGIRVYNTPGLNSEAVAELTIALALCVARRLGEFDRKQRDGAKVVRSQMLGKSLHKKTLGLIGMGNIGLEVANKWVGAMNGSVIAFDPYAAQDAWSDKLPGGAFRRCDRLQDLLENADVVSVHVPLTSSTRNLIGNEELRSMKKGSILLNCARGGVVDEEALFKALQDDHLFGAGLDALQFEPPTRSHYGETLMSHPRVVMTPHVGASTEENQINSGLAAVEILCGLLAGDTEYIARSLC